MVARGATAATNLPKPTLTSRHSRLRPPAGVSRTRNWVFGPLMIWSVSRSTLLARSIASFRRTCWSTSQLRRNHFAMQCGCSSRAGCSFHSRRTAVRPIEPLRRTGAKPGAKSTRNSSTTCFSIKALGYLHAQSVLHRWAIYRCPSNAGSTGLTS